jgi:leucyl-tRNA synthetase
MVYCDKCGVVPVPEEDLPVLLPEDAEFKPTGESPLTYAEQFVNTTCPKCGEPARRETDTMDTFMCSSWYFLRYTSPQFDSAAFEKDKNKYWMPVDIYTGGAEHAVMHLLYARFFIKAMRDIGLIDFGEPFTKLFNQGTIIAERRKMSKSRGNVITPDEYVSELGADAVRAYLMFIGPWELGGEWNDSGISGMSRWLNRIWNLVLDEYVRHKASSDAERELARFLHQTIKKVTDDMERLRFNIMIAALMEFTNHLSKVREAGSVSEAAWKEAIDALLLMLAPSVPHLAEELWQQTGHEYSIHNQKWPEWDEELAREEEITLVVQVNGKLRDRVTVAASTLESMTRDDVPKWVLDSAKRANSYLEGKRVVKEIYIPGKLVNFVVQ